MTEYTIGEISIGHGCVKCTWVSILDASSFCDGLQDYEQLLRRYNVREEVLVSKKAVKSVMANGERYVFSMHDGSWYIVHPESSGRFAHIFGRLSND